MTYIKKKTKRPLALWTKTFPEMHAKLRPELSPSGGIKARSGGQAVRMAVYRPIAEMFKKANPICQCCDLIRKPVMAPEIYYANPTDDVHHCAGRDGYLLFDIRHFKATCRGCHDWLHTHPAEAKQLNLLYTL